MKNKRVRGLTVTVIIAAFACFALPSFAGDIIGLADNANACGGATLCSTNGTTGYLNNGTGVPFDLSTINSWFQVDTGGVPNNGDFLVVNNTGAVVTSFSLTITDSFTSSTPSVTCSGSPSICIDNFQIHTGAASFAPTVVSLTGPDCVSGCGTDSANFSPGTVTYNWSGASIPIGATFDLNFASWNNGISAPTVVPEGSGIAMLGASGLVLLGTIALKRRSLS